MNSHLVGLDYRVYLKAAKLVDAAPLARGTSYADGAPEWESYSCVAVEHAALARYPDLGLCTPYESAWEATFGPKSGDTLHPFWNAGFARIANESHRQMRVLSLLMMAEMVKDANKGT